jgi:hypothetical protein
MPDPNVVAPSTDSHGIEGSSTSRRALLAGALGGIGALAAMVIGGPSRTQAAAGSYMVIGSEINNAGSSNTQLLTNSSVVAFKLLQNGPGTALMGYATPTSGGTRGVYGRTDSPNGFGVQARNAGTAGSGAAVQAIGVNNTGLDASTDNDARSAVQGTHTGGGLGVYGVSSTGYGVYGFSPNIGVFGGSFNGVGVYGSSSGGPGVSGISSTGYAGSFAGRIRVTQYVDIPEMSAPASPAANDARIFVRDFGGKTQVCAKFSNGSIVVMAAQP